MTEAAGGGRAEMERRLMLLDDPKGAIEQELETRLRESVEARVVQETADTIYLVG